MKWLLPVVLAVLCSCTLTVETTKTTTTSTTPSTKSPAKKSTVTGGLAAPKKATYLKPTKNPKALVDQFRALPADDVAFIKELDKQFATYGDNVKIKVTKVNGTNGGVPGKNVKRTINGEVGYGYQSNNSPSNGYYFSKPKFQIYPYSQHDIPPASSRNNHHQHQHQHRQHQSPMYHQQPFHPTMSHQPPSMQITQSSPQMSSYQNQHYLPQQQQQQQSPPRHTAVEIEASHSYELKQTENGEYKLFSPSEVDHHQQQQQQPQLTAGYYEQQSHHQHGGDDDEPVPVIVLRIPGPAKYAAHLQALLQQYLEMRAAEYIQTLQEHEHHQQQQQQQHQEEGVASVGQQQQYYSTMSYASGSSTEQPQHHQQQVVYHQQQQHQQYEEEGAGEHGPQQYNLQQQYEDEDPNLQQHIAYANPEQSQHQQQQEPEIIYHYVTEPPTDHHQHQHQQQPHYVYGPPQQTSEAPHLPVHENYPSSKHTQVYFPTSGHRGGAESSLRPPQPFHPPMIYADGNHESHRPAQENYPPLHQQQQQYEHDEGQPEGQHIQFQYVQEQQDTGAHENEHQIVSITQRPSSAATYAQQPYNYHAHQAAAHRPIVEQPVDAAAYVSGPAPHSMSKGAKRQTATFSRQQQYQEKVTKLISHMKKKKAESSSVAAPKTIATGDSAEGASEFQITVVRRH